MAAFATISGTMLTPGVSRNNRLYTAELIARAVERMNGRIADPDAPPIVMRTHHDAGDNTRQIVGRVTSATVDGDGNATYMANIYNTAAGRDLIGLIEGPSPALRNTSIYGYWDGIVRQVEQDGLKVETGDDIEIEAIDFTAFPGVLGAQISNVQTGTPRESTTGRRAVVTESLEPPVLEHVEPEAATEADEKDTKPYGNVTYADPGYQSDKVKRYPLDTKAHVRAAWSYINQKKNAAKYSTDDLAKIKGRIIAAAKKLGINISKETGELEAPVYEAKLGPVTECWDCDGDVIGFSITMWNGPLTVSVSANRGIADGDLPIIATAAMNAACDAVCAMDPDTDADFDVAGAPGSSDGEPIAGSVPDDNNMESAPAKETEPAPEPVAIPQPSETEDEAEESAAPDLPPVTVTPKQLAERLARRKTAATPTVPVSVLPAQLSTPVADQVTETTTTARSVAEEPREEDEESAMADTETTTPAAEQAAPEIKATEASATEAKATARTLTDEDIKALAGALRPTEGKTSEEPAKDTAATEATAPARTMGEDDVKSLALAIGAALGESLRGAFPAQAPAAAEVTESTEAPAAEPATETNGATENAEQVNATESIDMKVAIGEAVSEAVKEAIPTILDTYGLPRRRGFRTNAESTEEMTRDELWANRADVLLGGYGKPPTA